MSTYNESIKQILFEVQQFMNETIKSEKLSEKTKKHKTKIIELIDKIQLEYNALKLDKDDGSSSLKADDESVFTGGSGNSEEEIPYAEQIRDISAANLTQPLKTGYLEKRRKGLMGKFSYQRRYCVIHTAVLYYFEKPTDKKQKGAFHLNGYEFREAPHLVNTSSKKELSFELVGPGKRSYEFLAENKDEFNSWKEAVEKCHDEPISEELYEAIEDIRKPPPIDEGEEYEIPKIEQETYQMVEEDEPPKIPAPRKLSTQSVPKSPPPAVPKSQVPDTPPALPPSLQSRNLPAIPSKRVAKLDINTDLNPSEDFENMYYGKWDCTADSNDELQFNKGDIIHIISKDFDSQNWWVGEYKGTVGLVPKTYLAKAYELMR